MRPDNACIDSVRLPVRALDRCAQWRDGNINSVLQWHDDCRSLC